MCWAAALLGVLSATIVSFHSVSPTAAYLMVPYFGWTLYATGLTFAIYKKNPRVRVWPATFLLCSVQSAATRCPHNHYGVLENKPPAKAVKVAQSLCCKQRMIRHHDWPHLLIAYCGCMSWA